MSILWNILKVNCSGTLEEYILLDKNTVATQANAKDIQDLANAIEPVLKNILELKKVITDFIPLESKASKDVAEHVFSNSGKLVRPALYFMTCKMLGYQGDQLYKMAAVAEYVHTASLLHDDVVDNSKLRRNKKTANSIWGDESAVLVGDLIYSRASEMMAETGYVEMVSNFSRAIRMMSEGELLQLENLFTLNITQEVYEKILHHKTGVLIGAACRAASILSGCTAEQKAVLNDFGVNVGVAFQLIDDALDYIASEETFGKPTLADLIEGKVTLPVILLKECATELELESIKKILCKDVISKEDALQVADLVKKYQTVEKTFQKAETITNDALKSLRTHFGVSYDCKNLETLATTLLSRCN